MKKMMVILLLLLAVFGTVYFHFNKHKIQDSVWAKMNYPYLHEIHNPRSFDVEGYEFIKISDQKMEFRSRNVLYPQSDWNSTEISKDPNFWIEQSKVFYNPAKEIYGSQVWDGSWIFFTALGEILENLEQEDRPEENHASWDMIKDLGNWNYYSEQPSDIYVAHFAKQQYNWNRYNPLANIGSPTGGHGTYWRWKGDAYMKIQLEKGEFIFKTDGQLQEEYHDRTEYKVILGYYKIPKAHIRGKDVVLLYQESSFDPMQDGLYMIREK